MITRKGEGIIRTVAIERTEEIAVTIPLVLGRSTMDGRSRIARYMPRSLVALSLLLCLATAGLWARSYRRQDIIRYCRNDHATKTDQSFALASNSGELALFVNFVRSAPLDKGWYFFRILPSPKDTLRNEIARALPVGRSFALLGVGYVYNKGEFQPRLYRNGKLLNVAPDVSCSVHFPYWLLALISAVPPLLCWRRSREMGGRGFAVEMAKAPVTQ